MTNPLQDILTKGLKEATPSFDLKTDFQTFALTQDTTLDEQAAIRLADMIFNGTARLVPYNASEIRALTRAWFLDLHNRNQPDNVINGIKANLIDVAERSSELDLRRTLRESNVKINAVLIRRTPTEQELPAVNQDRQIAIRSRLKIIHSLIQQSATENGIQTALLDQPDVRSDFTHRTDHFAELAHLSRTIPGLITPRTVKYSEQKKNPQFPIVAKKVTESKGIAKYLIENTEQWAKFVQWVEDKNLEEEVENFWFFQEYIQPPIDRPTSLRVFTDCLGNVMASQLLYGPKFENGLKTTVANRAETKKNDPETPLEDPNSPYFLNSRLIAANQQFASSQIDIPRTDIFLDSKRDEYWENQRLIYVDPKTGRRLYTHKIYPLGTIYETVYTRIMGRVTIGFNKGDFTPNEFERELLEAHNFNPADPRLPENLLTQARRIL